MKRIAVLLIGFVLSMQADQKIEVPFSEKGERHIVIVAASYNNSRYFVNHLNSIFGQQYDNYHVIYIDDCSTDGTYPLVKRYIERRGMQDKVLLIHNKERHGALYNQYHAIQQCKDTDLIVNLDADDWFASNDVLKYLNQIYQNGDVWLTYGQFIQFPTRHRGWCVPMPDEVAARNGFRQYVHSPSHLRTFYAGLFKQIKKEDLMYEGDFFRMTGDAAAMFPMIEMAHKGHFQFLSKVLMVYNIGNPLCDHKVVQGLQQELDNEIRSRKKYDAIETPFLSLQGGVAPGVITAEG